MLRAIVFDFDGTLIDTTNSIWGEYKRVAALMGLEEVEFEKFTSQLGKPWVAALMGLWPDVDIDRFNKLYRGNVEKSTPIVGVKETLELLSKKYRLAILTSRGEDTLYSHLKLMGIDPGIFYVILHKGSITRHKPDPSALFQISRKLMVGMDDMLYVGDSIVDLECAVNAGVVFVAVLSGGTRRDMFLSNGAQYVIDSIARLPVLLERLR